jgi:hypothetical protein
MNYLEKLSYRAKIVAQRYRSAIPGEILTPRLWIEIYASSVYYFSILR